MKTIIKSLLISAAMLLGSLSSTGQENKRIKTGIMVGANIEAMSPEYAGIKIMPGADAGVFAELGFSEKWLGHARLQFSLNRIGIGAYQFFRDETALNPTTVAASDFKSLSLKMPLTAGYRINASEKAKIYFLAGPVLNYCLSGKEEIKADWWDAGWFDVQRKNDFQIDATLHVGTEIAGHHRVEISYDINLTNIAPRYNRRIHVFGLSYGYAF